MIPEEFQEFGSFTGMDDDDESKSMTAGFEDFTTISQQFIPSMDNENKSQILTEDPERRRKPLSLVSDTTKDRKAKAGDKSSMGQ